MTASSAVRYCSDCHYKHNYRLRFKLGMSHGSQTCYHETSVTWLEVVSGLSSAPLYDHMNAATNVQAACVVQQILSSVHFIAECYLMQPNLLFILPVPANAAGATKQIAAVSRKHTSSTKTAPSYQYSPSIDYFVWCCYHFLSAGVSVSI